VVVVVAALGVFVVVSGLALKLVVVAALRAVVLASGLALGVVVLQALEAGAVVVSGLALGVVVLAALEAGAVVVSGRAPGLVVAVLAVVEPKHNRVVKFRFETLRELVTAVMCPVVLAAVKGST